MDVGQDLRVIYSFFDDMFRKGNFVFIDSIIASFPLDDLDSVLGVLTASLPAQSLLPSRKIFLSKAKKKFGSKEKGLWDGL